MSAWPACWASSRSTWRWRDHTTPGPRPSTTASGAEAAIVRRERSMRRRWSACTLEMVSDARRDRSGVASSWASRQARAEARCGSGWLGRCLRGEPPGPLRGGSGCRGPRSCRVVRASAAGLGLAVLAAIDRAVGHVADWPDAAVSRSRNRRVQVAHDRQARGPTGVRRLQSEGRASTATLRVKARVRDECSRERPTVVLAVRYPCTGAGTPQCTPVDRGRLAP